ncbi:MAG: metallopeptidase family protein [Parvibaculaceae bacterium]|nr:metallopeptidase family protein [Parvibaculaceae bacterium]
MTEKALKAPGLEDFEKIAASAYARLPKQFRALCGNVVIKVEDLPSREVLAQMGIDNPLDLMGLYSGVELTRQSVFMPPLLPDMVFLYRLPILRYWQEYDETVEDIISHVLVHEIGHHFGLSDDDMEHIERSQD